MLIVTVCRSGPEYGAPQAKFLHDQLRKRKLESVCLTDLKLDGIATLPLRYPKFPGWWAKMELFDVQGTLAGKSFMYIDLDTKILGDIAPLIEAARKVENLVMLRDFYKPEHMASGVMYLPSHAKHQIWSRWISNYRKLMMDPRKRGDGWAIEKLAPTRPVAWQDIAPATIVSYKKHVVAPSNRWFKEGQSEGNGKMPAGALMCCYHGKPRPW